MEYRYEATVSGVVATVNREMDSQTTLLAGNTLMECNGRRALLFEIALQENLDERGLEEECVVVGMDSDPVDTVTEDPCDPPADDCVVIVGKMRTYTSGPGCVEQSENDALTAIMGGMNDDDTFLADSGTKYAVAGLTGTKFLTGTNPPDNTVAVPPPDQTNNIDKAITSEESAVPTGSPISNVGIAMLVLGILAIIALLVFMLVVKKRKQADKYKEFGDEEKDMDDGKTDISVSEHKKRAYVVGEEGSIYTNATHDTRALGLHNKAEYGNSNGDDQQVDVHHCTSATCPICMGKETVFVNAMDDESMEPEGYEFSYNKAGAPEQSRDGSFEYEPNGDVSSPTYDNPAEIERPYVVDDTVAF